jgi:hypothetical protein
MDIIFEDSVQTLKRKLRVSLRKMNRRMLYRKKISWIELSGSRTLTFPKLLYNRNMKVVRLSVLLPGCLYPPPPPGYNPGTHFFWDLG